MRTTTLEIWRWWEYKDQPTIKIYDSKKESAKQILISQELYDEIIDYKNELTVTNKYHSSTRDTQDIKLIMNIICFVILKIQLQRNLIVNSKEFSKFWFKTKGFKESLNK